MVSNASAKYIRISPRKARLVVDLIRGRSIIEAEEILLGVHKRAKMPVYKVLKSAVANAAQKNIPVESLFISKIVVEEGPTWKRYRAGTMGRGMPILKRTSHIKIELDVDYELAKRVMQRFSAKPSTPVVEEPVAEEEEKQDNQGQSQEDAVEQDNESVEENDSVENTEEEKE